MSELIVTSRPENFRTRAHFDSIPGDVFSICERLSQKYPSLIVTFKNDGRELPYIISENCIDGVIRYVAAYANLHSGVIEDLDYMRAVPFKERVRVAEARAKAHNDQLGKPDPEKQEKWMAEFRQDLIKAGFVHGAASGGRTRNIHRKGGGFRG